MNAPRNAPYHYPEAHGIAGLSGAEITGVELPPDLADDTPAEPRAALG